MPNDPVVRLEALFSLLVDQARADAGFAARLLRALEVPVEFKGEEAVAAIDPIILAGKGKDAFRSTMATFKDPELKKIIKSYDLALPSQLKGLKRMGLIDFMWQVSDQRRKDMSV